MHILKKTKKKILAFAITAAMLVTFPAVPGAAAGAYAAEDDNSFVIAAMDSSEIIIAPEKVSYSAEDTIADALIKSGHDFTGIDSGWVESIDGHTDNYSRFYDGGEYALSAPAGAVKTALVFNTVTDNSYSQDYLKLIKLLYEFEGKTDEEKNFRSVKAAYEEAIKKLPEANGNDGARLYKNLSSACDEYSKWVNSEETAVTVNIVQAGSSVDADISLEDTYGNTYSSKAGENNKFYLKGGDYSYRIVKGNNEVSGTFTVKTGADTMTVSAKLPSGDWFGKVNILDGQMGDPVANEGSRYFVKDSLRCDTKTGLYINAMAGKDCPAGALLYADYTGTNGTYYGDTRKAWEATTAKLNYLIGHGLEGKTFDLKAVCENADGSVQTQRHQIVIDRTPTLAGLNVENNGMSLFRYNGAEEYTANIVSEEIDVTPQAFGSYSEGYSVTADGSAVQENSTVNIDTTGKDSIEVSVSANGHSRTYVINLARKSAVNIKVPVSEGVTAQLVSDTGTVMKPQTCENDMACFTVAPGTYQWITTKDRFYHVKGTVEAQENTTVNDLTEPVEEELISEMDARITASIGCEFVGENKEYSWKNHKYKLAAGDSDSTFTVRTAKTDKNIEVTAAYDRVDGADGQVTLSRSGVAQDSLSGSSLARFIDRGCRNNSVTVTASYEKDNVTYYQDYELSTCRIATLDSLEVSDSRGRSRLMYQENDDTGFDSDVKNYTVRISEEDKELGIGFGFANPDIEYDESEGYEVNINGKVYPRTEADQKELCMVEIDRNAAEQTFSVSVKSADPENISSEYFIKVIRMPAAEVRFSTDPEDATVYIEDNDSGDRVWPEENGRFTLMAGNEYTYSITAYGYVGKTGTITPEESCVIQMSLDKAEKNGRIDTTLSAEWPYFRADENNNGVVDYPTPVKPEDAVLYWANKVGDGYSGGATGCPIIADGCIYTYAGTDIVKMDAMTGEVLKRGEMVANSNFAINSPTYAEGMIFVGLSNGRVQAFDAVTLESLWVYRDSLGGQPNCPITYKNGYIYTGFWNSETVQADMVCLSVTDEIPSQKTEAKQATWKHKDAGFYWAGAYVSDDCVLVGTDDGDAGYTTGSGDLLSLDPKTGRVIDRIENGFKGDIRSSICYDTSTDRYYFTTKGGYFCSVKTKSDRTFDRNSVTALYLDNYAGNQNNPPMSTCTPVIHNGRAYIGVSGVTQFGEYSGHNITVIDLTGSKPSIAYSVRTQGYPQTSGLLTTAYDKGDGTVYVYFFDNYTPGKMRVLKDKPGQEKPALTVTETDSHGTEYQVAQSLFTPYGKQAEYAICSPICDEWGNMYFKNDSAQMMMVGARVEKLEVTLKPTKTQYEIGQKFSASGMKVMATYANGKKRDVTKYVKYTTDPLTEYDTEIDIIFDLGENMKMYQNGKDGVSGADVMPPQTSVDITVKPHKVTPSELPAVQSVKITSGKKAFTLKWKKATATAQKKITGYQIKYSKYSSMENAHYIYVGKTATKKKVKKLEKKKKYYVEIGTYVNTSSGKVFAKSKVRKSVRTK